MTATFVCLTIGLRGPVFAEKVVLIIVPERVILVVHRSFRGQNASYTSIAISAVAADG